jgi:ATP-dependent DNA helicase RecG
MADLAPTSRPEATPAPAPARETTSAPQRAMDKLGLRRDIDLALHLPLRYEDETRLTPVRALRDGVAAQVEGVVAHAEVSQRTRRQLIVRLHDDAGDELVLRFLNFYPSQQKALAPGRRVRVRGEPRGGFFGREMVHPSCKGVEPGAPLATSLTPVYPTSAQLPQAYLRKAVAAALARADLRELLPSGVVPPGLPGLRDALRFLHHPPPDAGASTLEDHDHPAWERLKFEELLAQQLSQLQARRERQA